MLVDEEGRSLLHKAESPEQITLLLQNPLTDVNATNRVRQASLLRIDGALCPSLAPPVCFLLSDLLRANSILLPLPQAGLTALMAAVAESVGDGGVPIKVRVGLVGWLTLGRGGACGEWRSNPFPC